jgi:hypothetical protein
MDVIQVETRDGANAFLPGEVVEGTVSWQLDRPATTAELRLFWYTEGKGDQDVQIVETVAFANPETQERRGFRVRLPAGPFSFSGKLISLLWALEAVLEPGSRANRLSLVVSPTRREILLEAPAEAQGASPG